MSDVGQQKNDAEFREKNKLNARFPEFIPDGRKIPQSVVEPPTIGETQLWRAKLRRAKSGERVPYP